MDRPSSTVAQQIAHAVIAFEQQRTGHTPVSVSVVLNEATLVVTLEEALSPAEQTLAQSPAGAAQVQHFYRQLFAAASEPLRQEITRITGVGVREAAADVDTASGAVAQAFTNGTVVQVFLLAGSVSAGAWCGAAPGPQP